MQFNGYCVFRGRGGDTRLRGWRLKLRGIVLSMAHSKPPLEEVVFQIKNTTFQHIKSTGGKFAFGAALSYNQPASGWFAHLKDAAISNNAFIIHCTCVCTGVGWLQLFARCALRQADEGR